MQTFILDDIIKNKKGVIPFVETNQAKVEHAFYQKIITKTSFPQKDLFIYLNLQKEKGFANFTLDFHKWDLGHPTAYHIVCSPRFREVLERLHLPEHRFYDAEIKAGRRKHRYFVLHFIHDYLNDTCFESTVFARYNLLNGHAPDALLQPGEITDKTHYHTCCQQLVESMHWLYPQKLVFREGFNLDVWGLRGQIILSERARNAIVAAGITGVAMPPLQETEQFADMEIG